MPTVNYQADCNRCQGLPIFIFDAIEFILVCFCIELLQFLLIRQQMNLWKEHTSSVLWRMFDFFLILVTFGCL